MELKLLNAQGQAAGTTTAPETLFGREFNEALVHQIVVAYQANARQGTRSQKDSDDRQALDPQAMAPERHRPCACWDDLEPDLAWRWPHLPEFAGRELHRRRSTRRCIAPA